MAKRYIRLKELTPNLNKNYIPSDEYLSVTNGIQENEIYPVKTDSNGNQISIWGRDTKKRLYIIGDSTVESIYVKPSMRPHNCLERLFLEKGYDYSVFNLGVSGAHTLSIVNLIINKLGCEKGSFLVITLPSNDFSVLTFERNYFSEHWRYSSIIPALDKNVSRNPHIDYVPYIKNLEMIINICRILELQLLLTTIVYTGVNEGLSKLNDIIIDVCKSSKVPLIDFENKFVNLSGFFYDELHFLPKGSQFYAQTIFDVIKHSLISDGSDIIKTHNIGSDITLNDNIKWTEFFDTLGYSFIKVIVDADFGSDAELKQAIMTVDYDGADVSVKLAKSNYSEIGYFSYITGTKNKRIEVLLSIDIPPTCSRMRIGLRSWASKNVKVHKSFATMVKA